MQHIHAAMPCGVSKLVFFRGNEMGRSLRMSWGLGAMVLALYFCTIYEAAAFDPVLGLFLGYSKAVNAVALSPDGRKAVSGGRDNVLRLWDIKTGLLLRTFETGANNIRGVAFSPSGAQLLTGGSDNQVLIFDIASGRTAAVFAGHSDEVLSVAFSPSGRLALSGSKDKSAKLWDLQSGQLLRSFEGHAAEVVSVAFTSNERRAFTASKDGTLRIWDTEKGEALSAFGGPNDEITSAALTPDSREVAAGTASGTISIWNIETGVVRKSLKGGTGAIFTLAYSGDGSAILSGGAGGTVEIWSAAPGERLISLGGHSDAVTSAVFSFDGTVILSGSLDKTLKLWDRAAGNLRNTIDLQAGTFSPGGYRNFFRGASLAKLADAAQLDARLKEKGLKRGDPVFLRIFKGDLEVELWMLRQHRFELFATYPICARSGELGPKLREGDGQSPEGYYTIGKGQLNPKSHFHRAFNLGYPNAFDRAHNRTGAYLMIHGGCASIGCYAMTDAAIDELWQIATAALDRGQERIGVHVFPFRMTRERMTAFDWHPAVGFWRELKPAYDFFEETRVPPQISVCNGHYAVSRGTAPAASAPPLQSACAGGKAAAAGIRPPLDQAKTTDR
jgi:murein L,D-transpeptidase YafK